MGRDAFEDFMKSLIGDEHIPDPLTTEQQIEKLQDFIKELKAPCMFKVGDIVTQKTGYDYERYTKPKPGEPAIVISLVENPVITESERVDMYIALVTKNGRVGVYGVESFRFIHLKKE